MNKASGERSTARYSIGPVIPKNMVHWNNIKAQDVMQRVTSSENSNYHKVLSISDWQAEPLVVVTNKQFFAFPYGVL
jgi:hypothetical protein